MAYLTTIQRDDGKRAAALVRSRLIDDLDRCCHPDHPLGGLVRQIRTQSLQDLGMTEVDFVQRLQVALFPEEFLPDEETEELMRIARNKKHQKIAGLLPGSSRMQAKRLEAFIREKWLKNQNIKDAA